MNTMMRKIFIACFCLFAVLSVQAQGKFPPVDKSPLDISFYPNNYAILKIQDKATEPLLARVIYSRPQKNGRQVFGELVEYGSVWRLGANEATELELFKDAKIGNTKLKKGRYTLYAIPTSTKWTLILNRETDTWGAFKYDSKKDVVRIDLPVQPSGDTIEALGMYFEKNNNAVHLVMGWDDVMVRLPIVF